MAAYFTHFPTMLYGNTAVTNLIAKVKFDESVTKNLATFYPYTIKEGERADQIAQSYYEDASYDWIIYLGNDIADPYHDWPKSDNVFKEYIVAKYGTVANSQLQTVFWRVNYESDDSVITTAVYAALAAGQKQYWAPILGYDDKVVSYQRKPLDIASETNKVVTLEGTFQALTENTIIKQSSSVMGTVTFANTTTVTIKNVSGTWATGSNNVLFAGNNAPVTATITSSAVTHTSIPSAETTYWSPVSAFEYEQELNEQRKHIRILNKAYIDIIERDMRGLLAA